MDKQIDLAKTHRGFPGDPLNDVFREAVAAAKPCWEKPPRVACVEVRHPDTHGAGLYCISRLAGFDVAAEFDGVEEGEAITLTLVTMTEEETAALPEFTGW